MPNMSGKSHPHSGGDISHEPTTDLNLYLHKLQDHTRVLVTAQRPSPSKYSKTKHRPLVWVRVRVRGGVAVKSSLEVFRPHGDWYSSFFFCYVVHRFCRRSYLHGLYLHLGGDTIVFSTRLFIEQLICMLPDMMALLFTAFRYLC